MFALDLTEPRETNLTVEATIVLYGGLHDLDYLPRSKIAHHAAATVPLPWVKRSQEDNG